MIWFPIESVPKDGTCVLVSAGHWLENGKWKGSVPQVLKWMRSTYETKQGTKILWDGWVSPDEATVDSKMTVDAKYWMPIVATPKPGEKLELPDTGAGFM